jgi:CheY-specific phosphatase CheX
MELMGSVPEAVKQVFSEMFFTYVNDAAAGEEPRSFALESEIVFKGDLSGQMRLAFSQRLAEQLAANLVGVEPDELQPAQVLDAVKEAANILCGNLLRLAGVQATEIAVPVAGEFRDGPAQGEVFEFEAEGEPLRLVIRLEEHG